MEQLVLLGALLFVGLVVFWPRKKEPGVTRKPLSPGELKRLRVEFVRMRLKQWVESDPAVVANAFRRNYLEVD